jgi:hypothetical protein
VRKNGRNAERRIRLAITQFLREPVGIAVARANPAGPQILQRLQKLLVIQAVYFLFKFYHLIFKSK